MASLYDSVWKPINVTAWFARGIGSPWINNNYYFHIENTIVIVIIQVPYDIKKSSFYWCKTTMVFLISNYHGRCNMVVELAGVGRYSMLLMGNQTELYVFHAELTHWGIVCIYAPLNWVIIGLGNGLAPFWCQAIT